MGLHNKFVYSWFRKVALFTFALSMPFASAQITENTEDIELISAPQVPLEMLAPYYLPPTGVDYSKAGIAPATRAQTVALYNALWLTGQNIAIGWSGAGSPSCNPGTTSSAVQQAHLNRINFYRRLTGLPDITFFASNSTVAANAQSSALMQGSNDWGGPDNPHAPPATWTCYTAGGATAAGKSNLYKGVSGPAAIDGYIDDSGSNNTEVGHRRWILYPPLAKSYAGDIENNAAFPSLWPTRTKGNDLWVIQNGNDGTWGARPASPSWVAWPPEGYVPYQVLPSGSNRWSFSYPNANMSAATVTISRNGQNIPILGYDTRDNAGYGDATIVFRPTLTSASAAGVRYASPGAGEDAYLVTVSGMTGTGVPASVSYTVRVIDPTVAATDTPACGTAHYTARAAAPTAGELCSVGTASPVTGAGPWAWSCAVPASLGVSCAAQLTGSTTDSDNDGIPDWVETIEQRAIGVKDNTLFSGQNANSARWFVMQQYRDFLSREADLTGLPYWTGQLNSGALTPGQVVLNFFDSAEFQGTYAPIVRLYFAAFRRLPDYAGLQFWRNQFISGIALESIAQNFAASQEFLLTYGALDNQGYVTRLYQNVLGRPPDAAGNAHWLGFLNRGELTRGQVLAGFSESQEHRNTTANSVFVEMMYLGMLRRASEPAGFTSWVNQFNAGVPRVNLINGFLGSAEYRLRFLP
jgi:hypothetical protein